MDLDRIVAELKSERDRIGRAISALLESTSFSGATKRLARKAVSPKRFRGGITPAGRRRLAEAMKARWAARKAKSAPPRTRQPQWLNRPLLKSEVVV